jgi:Raf kinase inhibitor-like YbhB/YbcL family protein
MVRCADHGTRSRLLAALLLAASLSLTGCGLLSGPGTLPSDAPLDMEVNSTAFPDHGVLPDAYTCHGEHARRPESPPISWSGAPRITKSYVVIIDDSGAPITPRVYWIVFDIAASTADLQAGLLPPGARQARNSAGVPGYDPPCPVGSSHSYRISVYALNTVLNKTLPPNPQLLTTWTTIAPHVIGRGTMTVTACPGPTTHGPILRCQKVTSG